VPYRYPYWLVWQQRDVMSARQAHFAQWIEGQVDAYLRGGGAQMQPTAQPTAQATATASTASIRAV
jgi:LysR family glycine cleavage system transcriptional activator